MVITMIPTNERGPMKHIKDFINRMIFEQKDIITMVLNEPRLARVKMMTWHSNQSSSQFNFLSFGKLRYDYLVKHAKTNKLILIEIDQTDGHYDGGYNIKYHYHDLIKTYLCCLNDISLVRFREFDDLDDIRQSIDEAGYQTIIQSTLDRVIDNESILDIINQNNFKEHKYQILVDKAERLRYLISQQNYNSSTACLRKQNLPDEERFKHQTKFCNKMEVF